jgi:hypothetical protein
VSRARRTLPAALLVVAAWAAPALAHTVSGEGATNFRTDLLRVEAPAGVRVDVVENGSRLELVNDTGAEVLVPGYSGEPYLRVGPDGVFVNESSPAFYLNSQRRNAVVPAGVSAEKAPSWRRESGASVARWHDHRIHWMGDQPPPLVREDPDREHLVQQWEVPFTHEGRRYLAAGELRWIPGVSRWPWVGLGVVVAALTFVAARRRLGLLVGAVLVLTAVDITHQLGIGLVRAGTLAERLGGTARSSPVLVWVGAGVVAWVLLRRPTLRREGLVGTLVLAALLGLFGGVVEWSSLSASQPVFVGAAWQVRLLTALTLGLAVGVVAAAAGRVRELEPGPEGAGEAAVEAAPA